MSPENQTLLREQAANSHAEEYQEDFVYDLSIRAPRQFRFGINYKACGFCNPRPAMETKKSCLTFAGSISWPMQHVTFDWSGHERSRAVRATAISGSRGSSQNN